MSLRALRRARQRATKKRAWVEVREHADGSITFLPGRALRAIMKRNGLSRDMGEAMVLIACLRGRVDNETYAELTDVAEGVLPGLPTTVWREVDQLVAGLDAEELDKLHSFADPLLRTRSPMGSVLEAIGC